MKVTTLENAPQVPAKLNGKIIYAGEQNQIIHLSLEPGEEIPMHKNDVPVTFYVLQGKAQLTVDQQTFELEKDQCISIPVNADRALINTGAEVFRQLVIKNLE